MATAKNGARPRRTHRWLWLWAVAALLLAAWLAFGSTALGYAHAGTAYGARVACSCRYVAGRPLADCAKDKVRGMELVSLSENADEKSVTARLLVVSDTARMVPGSGCMLDPWED